MAYIRACYCPYCTLYKNDAAQAAIPPCTKDRTPYVGTKYSHALHPQNLIGTASRNSPTRCFLNAFFLLLQVLEVVRNELLNDLEHGDRQLGMTSKVKESNANMG